MLPMPCLPPIARSDFLAHFGSRGGLFLGDKALALKAYKKFRKIEQVPIGIWTELRASLSQTKLFRRWYQEWGQDANAFRPKPAPFENTWRTGHVEAHNSIDRATGSVLQEGGLFLSDSTFYGSGIRLDLYVQTDAPDGFERLLRHVAATGFGRDASTGKFCGFILTGSLRGLVLFSTCRKVKCRHKCKYQSCKFFHLQHQNSGFQNCTAYSDRKSVV